MAETKWHYFDSSKEYCQWEYDVFGVKGVIKRVVCGIDLTPKMRHTEFKDRITCKTCLKALNRIEGNI